MEDCFALSGKARASARGFSRFALLGCVFFVLLSLLSLDGIGSGFFVFSLIALYFLGMFLWQWRQYRMLERAAVMLDDDGVFVSFGGQEVMYSCEEVSVEQGCFPRALGLGKRVRVCRAFLLSGRELFVDVDTRITSTGLPVLKGRVIPLDASAYVQCLDGLERRGWNRPSSAAPAPEEGLPDAAGQHGRGSGAQPLRSLRIVYLGTGVLAFLAHILLEDPGLALVFLLLALACAGLFLNTLYTRA